MHSTFIRILGGVEDPQAGLCAMMPTCPARSWHADGIIPSIHAGAGVSRRRPTTRHDTEPQPILDHISSLATEGLDAGLSSPISKRSGAVSPS